MGDGRPHAGARGPERTTEDAPRLSYAQERLWFLDDFAPGSTEYNTGLALRLTGALDLTALRTAVDTVVARHEALRTTVETTAGVARQSVRPHLEVPVRRVDLSTLDDGLRTAELDRTLRDEQSTPFDLRNGPLIRVLLVTVSAAEHILVLSVHHLVTDGWSMGVIGRELGTVYAAALHGEQTEARLPELPLRYRDYAAWQRTRVEDGALDDQLAYWRHQLDGVEPLELPTDRPRPTVRTGAGRMHTFRVPAALTAGLDEAARCRGASLFMSLIAVTQLLFSRYSGQSDVAVGTVASGRERAELEDLVGFFVNTLVLRSRIDETRTFAELLDGVRDTTLAAYAHQDIPFDRVVEEIAPARDTSRTPLFQALVVLQNALGDDGGFTALHAERVPVPRETSRFDLTFDFWQDADGLAAEVEYSTDLFDAGTVERLCGHWLTLAEGLLAGMAESATVGAVSLVDADEVSRLGTPVPAAVPAGRSLPELLWEQPAASPDSVAVVCGAESVTYAELDARVVRLAGVLAGRGVSVESRVGVCLSRSVDLVVAVLAVLRVGGAYVPL
ncbi:condensation domain-containing protein, partial [Streptomyces sp. NRRL S-1868]|uniref:condensation domain-containing protein n=1 Tax=Streptomyces sp. NRRL S-1868 TaxID=1463892 RepID=UPI003B63D4AC